MSKPKFNMGDRVTARITGRITGITEYAGGYFSYRLEGQLPHGDSYKKFVDEQFLEPDAPVAANDNDIPLPKAILQRAA